MNDLIVFVNVCFVKSLCRFIDGKVSVDVVDQHIHFGGEMGSHLVPDQLAVLYLDAVRSECAVVAGHAENAVGFSENILGEVLMLFADDIVYYGSSELAGMRDPHLGVGHKTEFCFFGPAFDLDGIVLVIINRLAVVVLAFVVLDLGKFRRVRLGREIIAHSEGIGARNIVDIRQRFDEQVVG